MTRADVADLINRDQLAAHLSDHAAPEAPKAE